MQTLRSGWMVVSLLCAACLLTRAQVRADTPEPSPESEYHASVEEALREFEAQHYEEARSLFLRAHALNPSARTERALGLVEFELRNYVESVQHLETALASRTRQLDAALRTETERMLKRAEQFVGRITLDVKPAAAQVRVDQRLLGSDQAAPLLLAIGAHAIELQAPGFAPERRTLDIKGGEAQVLTIVMAASRDEAPQPGRDAQPSARRWYKSPWLWTGVALVVVGAGVGTAVALTREDSGPHTNGGTTRTTLSGP